MRVKRDLVDTFHRVVSLPFCILVLLDPFWIHSLIGHKFMVLYSIIAYYYLYIEVVLS